MKYDKPARWEYSPPTGKEIQALQMGVLYLNPYPAMFAISTSSFMGIVRSVWNWNSEKTKEILEIGESLNNDGMTMKKMIDDIKKQHNID